MEVSVEVTQGLERRMTVTLPANDVTEQVDKRLRSMTKTARVQGFRQGKVPLKIIKQRYQGQVMQEVMGDLVQSTFGQALSKEAIRPAGGPTLQSQDLDDENGFVYAVTFEVYPEVKVEGLDKINVEKPAVEVTEQDIDEMLETLRKQRVTYEEADRASQADDRIVVSFEGRIDGEVFPGGSTEAMPVVVGSGSMLKEFDDNLVGLKAGEEKTFEVTFPEDYHSKDIAGKTAEFTVKVDSVNAPVLPELDDEFAKAFGVEDGGMDKLREDVRENMQRELDQAVRSHVKTQVMDGLLENNEFDLPAAMVAEEIGRLRQSTLQEMRVSAGAKAPELPDALFDEQARKRVKLGLIIAELIDDLEVKLDQDKVNEEISVIASTYEQPEAVERAYRERPDLRQGIEGVVLENQVIEALLDKVNVKEASKGFYDVVHPSGR